jgi:hypothetical protein
MEIIPRAKIDERNDRFQATPEMETRVLRARNYVNATTLRKKQRFECYNKRRKLDVTLGGIHHDLE